MKKQRRREIGREERRTSAAAVEVATVADEPTPSLLPPREAGNEWPVPDPDLVWRVTGTRDVSWFLDSGRRSALDVSRALAAGGSRLDSHRRILDFGCGCGRILLWLEAVGRRAELHGVDIDGEAVEWARAHIPYARVERNDHLPPLTFPDDHFDLVYNHSVFTHLDADYQDAWLAELARVTAPGGLVLLTVHGPHALADLGRKWRAKGKDFAPLEAALREQGLVFIADDGWVGGPFPDFYHTTYHAPWYVFDHWSRFFDVCAYIVRGSLDYQDQVLLRAR